MVLLISGVYSSVGNDKKYYPSNTSISIDSTSITRIVYVHEVRDMEAQTEQEEP
jgi:hypothetical protein